MSGITMDNVHYNVAILFPSLSREFELVNGDAEGKAITGRKIRDILGTSYSYEMNVEPFEDDQLSYDAFFHAISAPVDYHTITLPYGQSTITFEAAILSGKDINTGKYSGQEHWGGLTVKFEPMEPQRKE